MAKTSRRRARWGMATGGDEFSPTQLGMTAWLRNSTTSGDITSWTSALDSNHGVANAARAPAGAAGSAMTFDPAAPDVMALQLQASTFDINYLAYYFWVKPTAVASTQMLLSINLGTGGGGIRVLDIAFANANARFDVYSSGANGRRHTFNSQAAAGTARMWGFEFNKDMAAEADRMILVRDGSVLTASTTADIGTGGVAATLVNSTGKALMGNFHDSVTVSNPFGGTYGRNFFCRSGSAMSGATQGVLTAAARAALFAFEPLT